VVVAADASGIAGDWRLAGIAGQPGCAVVCSDVSAGGGEKFGCTERAEAGHAKQDLCLLVFAEPGFDLLVDLGDFVMQVEHCAGESGHDVSTDFLGLDGGAVRSVTVGIGRPGGVGKAVSCLEAVARGGDRGAGAGMADQRRPCCGGDKCDAARR
jgi:hypothetical protein